MADIFPKVDDVIQKPDAAMYASKLKRTRPDSTGIVNYGLSRLVDIEEQLDEQALLDQYQEQLTSTNSQRSKLAEIAAAANAEMESRKDNLNFAAAVKDRIELAPVMQTAGIPMNPDGQTELDAINKQGLLAKIAKDKADAAKSHSDGMKKKIKYGYDEQSGKTGITLEGDWTPQELVAKGIPQQRAEQILSGDSTFALTGDQTSNMGGQSNFQGQAAAAAAPIKVTLPSGSSAPIANVQSLPDGSFIGEVHGKSGITKVRMNSDGRFIKREQ